MPLTELIIDGFKSFAEKTSIHFNKGITGIVGPNGSGKSNITEAIRWAMGESRAKTLRGNNMKDIIFAGSEFRKPLNRAEVTLVFDNKNRELSFDQDRVAITRRILRSGDNEYLINNQTVRLKDVRELFLDSGMSQNSLAIISQGRVDQILNSRPEDRREIFEEAAGVLHFKQQKESAQAQLEKTNDNLIRINDLVKELETRIEPLHEQSSLAKEYKFQKAGLDQKLKTLLAFQIEDLSKQKKQQEDLATKNQKILSKLDEEVKQSQAAVIKKRDEYKELREKREKIQGQLLELTQTLSEINTNLQVTEQSKQFDEATKTEYKNQMTRLKEKVTALSNEISDLSSEEEKVNSEKEKLQAKRDELTGQLNENPDDLNKRLEDQRNEYIQVLQDQTSTNNQLVYLRNELKKTSDDTSYQNTEIAEQLEKAKAELENLRKQGKDLTDERRAEVEKNEKIKTEVNKLASDLEILRKDVIEKRNKLQQVSARHEALVNIQKRHEGYYYGVRNVLNHLDNYPGVIGAVGELIAFSNDLEAAMTTALGGGVQNLVTESRVSARDAINTLKRTHAGRATFLPLDGLRSYTIPSSTVTALKNIDGFVGVASDLVTSKANIDISAAIKHLLGNVIIVKTIENAMVVSRKVDRYRVVTLDGDVISPGGSMTGGVRNQKSNSPLQTTAEINTLEQKMITLKQQFEDGQKQLEQSTEKLAQTRKQAQQIHDKISDLSQNINETAISFQSQDKEVKRLIDANKLQESRIKEREDQIASLNEQIDESSKKQEELAKQADLEKNKIAEIQARINNFASLNQKIQDQLTDLDPKIAVFANKLENLLSQKRERNQQLEDNQGQLDSLQQKLEDLSHSGELSVQKKKELQDKSSDLEKSRDALQKNLNELSAKLGQFDAQINQLDQVASRNYDLRKNAATEQEEYSVKIAKFNSSINQKLETLSEEYSLTYEAALANAEGKNDAETRDQLAKSVKLHKMSIEDIGPVNLDSIEEYENVKTRYDFLNQQQNDLLDARKDLEQSMIELDKEVKTRFGQTFNKVAASFTQIFPVVFGGGEAKLVLTDPDNLLETGIEIIAQPPGKKLQRLSLLSGGERALTAITLLFAMLQVNPVPFCILDEVEAALDDANVTRFAQFLQKYDMHTQFIVITHRRGTMQEANQLFGVVMQESGVSQVLSVSLDDIKDEVKN
ncbi:MAG: chromosome segregation protein SMC [Lactobacillus sp.]|nr:chromosome segregation protein SMC [Lactobacillus sp.]